LEEHKVNTDFEILTPDGWMPFHGIRKVTKDSSVTISAANRTLTCSPNHPLKTPDGWILASELSTGSEIYHQDQLTSISSIETSSETIELFDVLEVKTHEYYTNDFISHNCDFVGSIHTLISPSKLKTLAYIDPIHKNGEGFKVYEKPEPKHTYVLCVDVSRGQNIDYSAFTIMDITTTPYKLVATFKNNTMSPMVFPNAIHVAAKQYNNAYVLIEINDMGGQVAEIMHSELEYENLLSATLRGRKGQVLDGGFGGGVSQFGVRMSEVVKRTGCSILKSLIEGEKILIQDFDVIKELFAFVSKKNSFEAEVGYHDDLVMTLVIFGWLSSQPYFKDLSNLDIRKDIYQDKIKQVEEEMTPFGFMDDGVSEAEPWEKTPDGTVWYKDREKDMNRWY
jgi:hypothetical protein